jgi:hypothetical protein
LEEVKLALQARLMKALGVRGFQTSHRAAYGCELWADYLLELDQLRQFGEIAITAEEARGLLMLETVRAETRREVSECPKCGAATLRTAGSCPRGHKAQ